MAEVVDGGCRQALADRFVEAFAERLHADIRRQIWGYAPEEKASHPLLAWVWLLPSEVIIHLIMVIACWPIRGHHLFDQGNRVLTNQVEGDDLFKLKYQGIRPAPGYPSQPDHTEKRTMWDLLKVNLTAQRNGQCGQRVSCSVMTTFGTPSHPILQWRLQVKELAGIELSESLSMMPASSVSALVFGHPDSEYFAVGTIGKDQVSSTIP